MQIRIRIRGAFAELHGIDPGDVLPHCLSFLHPSRRHSDAFRRGDWDGKVDLFNGRQFPAGLAHRVAAFVAEKLDRDVEIDDEVGAAEIDLSRLSDQYLGRDDLPDFRLRPHQLEAIQAALTNPRGIIKSPTGSGKCLALETPVLCFDGEVKRADEVQVGDRLMGPDSTPRRVRSTARGKGPLYRITPHRGQAFVCNDVHVLTLVDTVSGCVVDVPLDQYLRKSKTFRHCHKLFQPGLVCFRPQAPPTVDPYFVGVWLGDGTKKLSGVAVTKDDPEVHACVEATAKAYGLRVADHTYGGRTRTLAIVSDEWRGNGLLDAMRELMGSVPRIPAHYRTGSAEVRREVLAGLLDTDGHLSNGCFDFVQKSDAIFEDVLFVARSLGLRASEGRTKVVNGSPYRRASISGDLDQLPLRIPRKQAAARQQRKDHRRRGFTVEAIGDGPYVGWTLDGDGRFLLGDFTVTHNTEMIAAVAKYLWEEFQYRTLIVTPKKGPCRQTYERLQLYYQGDLDVGMLAEGRREVGHVTVATGQTLARFRPRVRRGKTTPADAVVRDLVHSVDVLMYDECHRASSETWHEVGMSAGNVVRRYGFSGTPLIDADLLDAKLMGVTGPVICDVRPDALIEQGFAARPKIVMVMSPNASGPPLLETAVTIERNGHRVMRSRSLPYRDAYRLGIIENEHHNAAVLRATEWLVERGRQTIVLCRYRDHFRTLAELFEGSGLAFAAVWGASANTDRDHAKRAFAQRSINVVLATTIWDEAEDISAVDAIVLAEGVKVSTNSRQRVGRGMRPDSEDVWVVDFVPTSHKTLHQHAYERAAAYESEGYDVRVLETWPPMSAFLDDDQPLLPFETWD